jgi:hypothetical protein
VFRAERPRGLGRWILFAYLLLGLLMNIGSSFVRHRTASLGNSFAFAVLFAVVLLLGIRTVSKIALEVRDRGVLCGKCGVRLSRGKLLFVPWNQISVCLWVPKGYGSVARIYEKPNHFNIAEDSIVPGQKTAITAALGRFSPVYDEDGSLLAEPEQRKRYIEHVPWQSLDYPGFQYDLQTMLLATVVVACAASLCGVHFHSPHYQAVARIEAFSPKIDYVDNDVWSIDFSACKNKPTDADLANLEPLTELVDLDLDGSPITDAGLIHLYKLKNLRYVILANTGVTAEGMERLRRALPEAGIK